MITRLLLSGGKATLFVREEEGKRMQKMVLGTPSQTEGKGQGVVFLI